MTRGEAYAWLQEMTGVAHIGEANEDECLQVIEAVYARELLGGG